MYKIEVYMFPTKYKLDIKRGWMIASEHPTLVQARQAIITYRDLMMKDFTIPLRTRIKNEMDEVIK